MIKQLVLLLTLSLGVVFSATPVGANRDNAAKNNPSYWETNTISCVKTEMNGKTSSFSATGDNVEHIVVKGGPDRALYTSGDFTDLTAPLNPNSGKNYAISHVIVCTLDATEESNSDEPASNGTTQEQDDEDDTKTTPVKDKQNTNKSHKVTVCHRTASTTNPYVRITVDSNAVDGETGNSNRADHYDEHMGPVFPATSDDGKWGDIIPPVGNHNGANWTEEGRAIYDNGCKVVQDTPETPDPETPEQPEVGGSGGGVVESEDDSPGHALSTATSLPSILPQTGIGATLLATLVLAVAVGLPTYIITRKFE